MAIKKFFGDIGTYNALVSANYHVASIHSSSFSGLATLIKWQSSGSGNIKPQVYHGADWATSERILYSDVGISSAIGLNEANVTPTELISGDTYWFAGCVDANGVGTTRTVTGGSYKYKSVTYSSFNSLDPPGSSGYGTVTYAALRAELWGYTPPVITSINGGAAITDGQTGIALVGTDLIDSVGNPALWLCSTNDFATAPIKVAQTVTGTPADTGIDFTVVHGGLSAGPVYAFVVSALGQVSAPLAVTLDPSGPPPEFIAGVEEIIISTASVAANTLSLIKITPALGGYAEQIRVFSKVDSNVIGVLYSDVLGEPGDLLAVSASVLATAEEWTVLAIDSTRINQVDYWVGAISDTMGGVSRQSIAGYVSRRKSVSFAGFIPPDPAGSGYTADTIAYSLAVYGVLDATDPLIGTLKKIMLFGSILEPTEIMSLHNRAMGEF